MTAGKQYLIAYTSGSTTYVATTTYQSTSNSRYPYMAAVTLDENGNYANITLGTTTYGSDLDAFLFTASQNGSSYRFNNATKGYLAFNSSGYPTFADSGLIDWTLVNSGTTFSFKNTSYTYDSYVYLGFSTSKYLTYSSSAKYFTLYEKLDGATVTTAPTAAPTAEPTATPATGSDTYTLITSVSDITDGDYILVGVNGSYTRALGSTLSSGRMSASTVTISNSAITDPDASIVWTITKTSAGYYTLYNASTGKYLYISGSTSSSFKTSTSAPSYYYSITAQSSLGTGAMRFQTTQSGARCISLYRTDFRTYSSSSAAALYLYKAGN